MIKIKHFFCVAFIFTLSVACFAMPDYLKISIEPLFGLKSGNFGEYVFLNNPNYSDDKLSYLDWEFTPSLYYGIKSSVDYKNFTSTVRFTAGIPKKVGIIKDSDWLNNDSDTVSSTSGYNYKTNYSKSDNYLDSDIDFSINGGWNFYPLKDLTITPNIGFEFSRTKFLAKNGYCLYGKSVADDSKATLYYYPYNDPNPEHLDTGTFSGTVLTYTCTMYITWFGLDLSYQIPEQYTFNRALCLNVGFFTAPYIYALSEDSHPLKYINFADLCNSFFKTIKINAGATYAFRKNLVLDLDFAYFKLFTIRGESYFKYPATKWNHSTTSKGGIDCQYFDFSLGIKYVF